MTAIITKGPIGAQDFHLADGTPMKTFTRLNSTGGTITLNDANYEVDALISYGGGTSYTQATIAAALTAIGTTNKSTLLLRPGTWVISSNADWSAYTNVTFKIVPGAVISHGAFTVNIPNVDARLYKIFNGSGVVRLSRADKVFPEWWGAVPDGTTNSSPAVTAVINSLFASGPPDSASYGINTLSFSNGVYYFDSPVSVLFDSWYSLHLTGTSTASMVSGGLIGGTKITGKAAIESMFILTKTDPTVAGGYSFECDHISFESGALGVTGPVTAIKNKVAGYPARPFVVKNCNFRGFTAAIVSDITVGATGGNSLTTGIAQVIIKENNFNENVYALKGMGGLGAIMDLDFSNNTSENGGKILTTDLALAGSFRIDDNLLEGQSNTIVISAGLANGEIKRNYFEANTLDIVNFIASNGNASLEMGGNYYHALSNKQAVTLENVKFVNTDDFVSPNISFNGSYLRRKSDPGTNKYYFLATPATGINNISINAIMSQQGIPATLNGTMVSAGTTLEETPLGIRGVETFTTGSSLFPAAGSLSVDDFVVVTALVKDTDSGTVNVALYDNANTYINGTADITLNPAGEYTVVHAVIKATATSTTTYKIKFFTVSGKIASVVDFYTYKAAGPAGATAYYSYLPKIGTSGQATISNPATSVAVTHRLGLTPRSISLTAGAALGHVWADTVGATQFTINVETSPGSSAIIYWKAN